MMQKRLEVGSHVFIIESNRIITEVVVTANRGDFCVLRFPIRRCHPAQKKQDICIKRRGRNASSQE